MFQGVNVVAEPAFDYPTRCNRLSLAIFGDAPSGPFVIPIDGGVPEKIRRKNVASLFTRSTGTAQLGGGIQSARAIQLTQQLFYHDMIVHAVHPCARCEALDAFGIGQTALNLHAIPGNDILLPHRGDRTAILDLLDRRVRWCRFYGQYDSLK
jgi:hypothetical protein